MTASGFAMSEKRARRYDTEGYRVIRPGTPLVATEYCAGGRCVQMAGDSSEVLEKLKGGRE